MRARHGYLDGLARERRDGLEFVDKTEIDSLDYGTAADGRGVKNIRVMTGDRLRFRFALKRGYLLPEVVEHCIRRRVAVVRPAMQLAAADHINSGNFLFQNGGLRCT